MAAIRFANFSGGLAPAVAPELLPDAGAQVAVNCRLTSGDIEPLHAGDLTFTSAVPGPLQTIFRIKETAGVAWLAWANEVDCVKGPIIGLGRYYYTGDNEPRLTTRALAVTGGAGDYPNQCRALGVPKPITAPTVTPTGGSGGAESRYYTYTFYDDLDQESANSPLSALTTHAASGTWAITGMDAAPPNSGDITALTYVGSSVTITTTNTHFNRVGETIALAGVTTVTNVNGTWVLTAVDIATKKMTFTVTGTPAGTYVNGTDTTDTWTRKAPFGTCTKRLYRTSGTAAQFQLVAEGITTTTYDDTLSGSAIPGDELISAAWEMPPVGLKGLKLHPSGALIGFVDNLLYASEPYQPHAWPASYQMRTDYPIVALAIYGSNIAVATTGTPYVAYGTEPGQIALQAYDAAYPCLSSRSMVGTLTGAVYASSMGLVQVSDNGVEPISLERYSELQWTALQPSLMVGAYANGNLFYWADDGTRQRVLVFGKQHTETELAATALYTDRQDGRLYYALGQGIYEYDAPGLSVMVQDWKSKEYVLPEPRTLTAAKILFDTAVPQAELDAQAAAAAAVAAANAAPYASGQVNGALNYSALNEKQVNGSDLGIVPETSNTEAAVSFDLYADGVLKYSTVVRNTKPFRLPSGYQASRIAVRVVSTCRVKAIELADNPMELKRV